MISLMVRAALAAIVVGGMLLGLLSLSNSLQNFRRHTDAENAQIACIADPHCSAQ